MLSMSALRQFANQHFIPYVYLSNILQGVHDLADYIIHSELIALDSNYDGSVFECTKARTESLILS